MSNIFSINRSRSVIAWLTAGALAAVYLAAPFGAPNAGASHETLQFNFLHGSTSEFAKDGDFDSAGNFYSPGQAAGVIKKYDANGNLLTTWNTVGTQPFGIALDGNDDVWVANTQSNTIDKFDSSGNFLGTFGTSTTDQNLVDGLNDPSDIDYDAGTNRLYVLDSTFNRIQVLDTAGNFVGKIDYSPAPTSNVNAELGLVVNPSANRIYMTDGTGDRVWVYDMNGTHVTDWPTTGTFPHGIDQDSSGNLHVTEFEGVGIYQPDGTLIETYASALTQTFVVILDASGNSWVFNAADRNWYVYSFAPPISQCSLDALAEVAIVAGDLPATALNGLEDACNGVDGGTATVLESNGTANGSLKLESGDALVLGTFSTANGTTQTTVEGSGDGTLILGEGAQVNGSVKNIGTVVVAGSDVTISGSVTGIGTLYYLPGASLTVGGQLEADTVINL